MTGSTPATGDDIKKLWGMIKDIRVTMMTTIDDDGTLRSRPMVAQQSEFDGDLWFFTWINSPKVDEVKENRQVNLSYAEPDDQNYVSISGTAQIRPSTWRPSRPASSAGTLSGSGWWMRSRMME